MSSRKIWSIPIAVLALVLMLAGALVTTSIVQAQSASNITVDTSNDYDSNGDGTDDAILFIILEDATQVGTVAFESTADLDDDEALNFTLQGARSAPFRVAPAGVGDGANGGRFANITVADDLLPDTTYYFDLRGAVSGDPTDFADANIVVQVIAPPIVTAFKDDAETSYDVEEHQTGFTDTKEVEDFGDDVVADPSKVLTFSVMEITDVANRTTAASRQFEFDGSKLTTTADATGLDAEDSTGTLLDPAPSYLLEITVSDGTVSDTLDITVTVTNVDPETAPVVMPGNEHDVPEDTVGLAEAAVTEDNAVAKVVLKDASDADLTTGYKLYPTDSVWKITDAGLVYLNDGEQLDFEDPATPNVFRLTVTVLDSSNVLQGGPESLTLYVTDSPEAPEFVADMTESGVVVDNGVNVLYVLEDNPDKRVGTVGSDGKSNGKTTPGIIMATDEDAGDSVSYALEDTVGDPYAGGLFAIDATSGQLSVIGELEADVPGDPREFEIVVVASDTQMDSDDVRYPVTIRLIDVNEGPVFTPATVADAQMPKSIDEGLPASTVIMELVATDPDLTDDLNYEDFEGELAALFDVEQVFNADGSKKNGYGRLVTRVPLDFETESSYKVSVKVADQTSDAFVDITVNVNNLDDEIPMVSGDAVVSVSESDKPGYLLGTYTASDADGDDLTFSLEGADAGNYTINDAGELRTAVWLDYDTNTSDNVVVVVNDSPPAGTYADDDTDPGDPAKIRVRIDITDVPDSISNINVSKANPVPGSEMGDPGDALDDSPANYVSTEDANWGTVLRIEVTRVSPDPACIADCVFVDVESDSADGKRRLTARRTPTQEKGNVFVAAVMLVQTYANGQDVDMGAGVMAYLVADEEDEINIRFDNTRDSVDVENDAPEIENLTPVHEAAIDEYDVDYTFTVTDSISGIPSPEDLPDTDGDDEYTSVVAMISDAQCSDADDKVYDVSLYGGGINCAGNYEFRPIVDDKDFNEVDGGFDVETTIAFAEADGQHFVTFIVCDAAGNCVAYDPDVNDEDVALSEVTLDKTAPRYLEARTGVKWDSTDNKYDDDRNFIQVVFEDLTPLNPETVEVDDFVVSGHSVKAVHMFDPDDEDTLWGDGDADTEPTRFGQHPSYQEIDRSVFIELEDQLAPDETPDVTLVPNGVEDAAGNEQDDGEEEADDWIAPSFTVVSLVSPRATGESEVLAGDGDEVVVTLTVDERLRTPRPDITISYVNAPDGCVDTEGRRDNDSTSANEARARGEIITGDEDVDGTTLYCANSAVSSGADSDLKFTVDKVSNTEWVIAINEPKLTGYYNFYVEGYDRSQQRNKGSEGVAKDSISTDFFKKNGEVNTDDAHFFEGDVNLSNPEVRISGDLAGDKEPEVELTFPLFIELDFTQPHSVDCDDPADKRDDCMAESAEYAEDNYSSVTVTSFMLNGVDVTDSVKTTDDETFLVALDGIAVGEHEIEIQAMDAAGNELDDTLEIEFEVVSRGAFEKRLSPGWNLVSLPGEPADSSIASVFGPGVEVRTVYGYDPVVPGGWMVAVRETLDSDWQGDLTEIDGQRGYWVLSDAIQDWEVSIPRLAGGAAGTGTPIQPPSIPLYAGWNLIPVTDVTGNELDGGATISANAYLQGLNDGIEAARVLGFNTIKNEWSTVDAQDTNSTLMIGFGYWVFVREATILVPGQ